ncbi:MAG: efflux RND transporter permease subunit [Chitinispirillaceae bacterium]|nr:efflux RND transporter permease subunit [Chitinispirillaceae bacterium]
MIQRPVTPVDKLIRFFLDNKLVTALLLAAVIFWGIIVAPFEWEVGGLPRDPVPVDAIPDIGENQQIVFTRWMGRSPQDIEDQITYPLTVSLLGIPGVRTVRSFSMFGFSSIYVIFKENVEFYWSRSRILEKIASLPPGTIPEGVRPTMGPDATALGQVFWYTLEGRDRNGNPTGGWDLEELRSVQDFHVRYGLMSADGVAEVASIGGFVKEYQIDVDPAAMRVHNVTLEQVVMAAKQSNLDVGARTIEINSVEYVIRGIGFVKSVADLEKAVVRVENNIPITIGNIAKVHLGPALRRGVLDKGGTEAVGGVVVTRYGENPLAVIGNVKKKIAEIAPGLPEKRLADGAVSKITIVPFYDRTGLIRETLGTLNSAIYLEILITILVILIMLNNLGSSFIISMVLPVAVLMSFIGMKLGGVDANIVSLSGIAIAIGTVVDMGIVLSENVLKRLHEADESDDKKEVVFRAASEVGSAILTAVLTTVVSFLPVFTMQAAEGKLFKPLAYTKTFALIASIILALTILPSVLHVVFGRTKKEHGGMYYFAVPAIFILGGIVVMVKIAWWIGLIIVTLGLRTLAAKYLPKQWHVRIPLFVNSVVVAVVGLLLTTDWMPLGAQKSLFSNLLFIIACVGGLMLLFSAFIKVYSRLLAYFLAYKSHFLIPVSAIVVLGMVIWMGFRKVFFFLPDAIHRFPPIAAAAGAFPGLGKEFMPPLDEGSYLFMPTTMTHASIGEVHDILRKQDRAITAIPEVESAVGKLGRVESPLDPAPISMIETIINIKSEYMTNEQGKRLQFKYDRNKKGFFRDGDGNLIPDPHGRPYRQWRDTIRKADDIWNEIVSVAQIPGVTAAPKLQPIAARIVMLQSGMRAPMGIKVRGPDLSTIERFGMRLEKYLKEVPTIEAAAVFADRIVGKPYLEIEIDRDAIARYGISIRQVQTIIEVALGGMGQTTTVEGRERYTVRVRYPSELRGLGAGVDDIKRILVTAHGGAQIPLAQLARIVYRRGPQVIKSEDTFLTGYVLFDMKPGNAEVDVVKESQRYLKSKIDSGELIVPNGVGYVFAGSYENQVRSEKRLALILPIALFLIFLILYFQFKKVPTTLLVFAGILVAWSGGFILIWLYGQGWFLNLPLVGEAVRELFRIHPINLSVAIWVGFLALFGIASDNGVVICTYLDQQFGEQKPATLQDIRKIIVEAAQRRVRPALMTSATTILALMPILTSTGRGADVMVPMAIPTFGGMMIQLATILLAPILYSAMKERELRSVK